jgi:hypothetical protein
MSYMMVPVTDASPASMAAEPLPILKFVVSVNAGAVFLRHEINPAK